VQTRMCLLREGPYSVVPVRVPRHIGAPLIMNSCRCPSTETLTDHGRRVRCSLQGQDCFWLGDQLPLE
jgi:hypothetical protein